MAGRRQRVVKQALALSHEQEAKTYAKLKALAGMTPTEVKNYIDANVTDLASAKDVLKTLAIAVSIMARRLYREDE